MTEFDSEGGCPCGKVRFRARGRPLLRAYCHCTICQAFNRADRADIIVMRQRDVSLPPPETLVGRSHRWPPLLTRSRCAACGAPAIETLSIPAFPRLTVLPAQTLRSPDRAPPPAFHMFYDTRVAAAADDLPKVSGYLSSQLRFSAALLAGLAGAGSHRPAG